MGEYANDQFRREIKGQFGFDPGAESNDNPWKQKPHVEKFPCPTCGKRFTQQGLNDHNRDAHDSKVPPKKAMTSYERYASNLWKNP